MSVDSLYFCSDTEQAERWWQQPIRTTLNALRDWDLPNEHDLMGLLDEEFLRGDFIPHLDQLAEKHDEKVSLAEICQLAVDSVRKSEMESQGGILSRMKSKRSATKTQLESVIYIGSHLSTLVYLSRKGPVAEPANTKVTDIWFSEFLERYMPADEAQNYNGSLVQNNLGPYRPPQLDDLSESMLEKVEFRMQMPYRIDAKLWLGRWEKLEGIPGLWEALEEEGIKPPAITHIRSIREVCGFSIDEQLPMFKSYV